MPNGSPIAIVDEACGTRLRPLYDALRDVDARLDIGMNRAQYGEKLGDVSVAYNTAAVGGFTAGACLDTAKALETALNDYIAANTAWGDCIESSSCDVDTDALPGMRTRWERASGILDQVLYAFP